MFKVNLAAFYSACGIVPPNVEPTADESGAVEIKDGTDFASLCRRSGVPSDAAVTLTFPDVCFVPPPPEGPVPIPYPTATLDNFNSEVHKSGFPKIKIKDAGNPLAYSRSIGNEPGTQKGIVSPQIMGKTTYAAYSFDVKSERVPIIVTPPSFR
jgi:hypothetical protein